jgi:hypothetical protein
MAFEVVDPQSFVDDGFFREGEFQQRVEAHDWSVYADRQVLIRGCGDAIVPPWAFMVLTAKLASYAKSIRYGNEHSNLVVYRRDASERA